MIKRILNSLLANGLWFAAIMLNTMSAAITSIAFLVVAVVIKWFDIKI
jgi:hypothetical protein